jgi:hypothetical protein
VPPSVLPSVPPSVPPPPVPVVPLDALELLCADELVGPVPLVLVLLALLALLAPPVPLPVLTPPELVVPIDVVPPVLPPQDANATTSAGSPSCQTRSKDMKPAPPWEIQRANVVDVKVVGREAERRGALGLLADFGDEVAARYRARLWDLHDTGIRRSSGRFTRSRGSA